MIPSFNQAMSDTIQNRNNARHEQTIVAQCTPQGPGAISLIRFSGIDAVMIADKLAKLPAQKKLSEQKSHTIHYGYVIDAQGQHIDQVLFLLMRGPHTFTGQDVVEITGHNNQFLIEAIIDRALQCGARLATNGEFTQRAVEQGKMDLVQAEAMNDLIHAQTAESLKYSLSQLQGTFSSWIASIEQSVIEMLAFCEGSFEFLDEEGIEFVDDIKIKTSVVIEKIEALLSTYSKQQYIKDGIRIALVGSVNVGKSSLFNCLINKKRSIVTEIAGTTRDIVESGVYKDSGFLTFVDTAGIRETDDRIEKEGIDRSLQEVVGADIVLLVIDGSQELSAEQNCEYKKLLEQYGSKIIVVQNKMDLMNRADLQVKPENEGRVNFFSSPSSSSCSTPESIPASISVIQVSAKENINIDRLHAVISQKMQELKGSGQVTCLLNQRQYTLLSVFLNQLKNIVPMLRHPVDYELISYRLRESLQSLSEVSGRSVSEAVLNQVFQSFCVGK